MKVGLFSDMHGYLPALEDVLGRLQAEPVDQIVCLGDVAVGGPQPIATLERLAETGCPVIIGNTDEWLLGEPQAYQGSGADPRFEDRLEFAIAQLAERHRAYLRSFVPTLELDLGSDVRMLCFHGSPRSHSEGIGASTEMPALIEAFDGHNATLMAGGHTHRQLLRRVGGQWLINPGSIGMTFEQTRIDGETRRPPWAEYAVVHVEDGAIDVSLRAVPLDLDELIAVTRASGMPHSAWWIEGWTGRGHWN